MRITAFLAAALTALSLLGGGKIYDEDGNPKDLEATNLLMQVAQDLTTVEDLASFGGTITNVTVDGVSVMSNKTASISSFGRFKRLGKYLWEGSTEGENWTAATNVLEQHYPSYGMCSGVHAGHFHGRTYDWYYDKCAEFIVRNPAKDGKPASIGVASGFKSLTDDFLETGKWNPSMYLVPFAWTDGMNENGVVIQTNVTPSNHVKSASWRTKRDGCVAAFLVVRQALTESTNALTAAQWVKAHTYIPPTFEFDCHFMVSDATSCYIVEDGEIIENTTTTPTDVMTNFRLRGVTFTDGKPDVSTVEEYGMGIERYNDVRDNGLDKDTSTGIAGTMKRLYYTRSYDKTVSPFWYTEYVGDHTAEGYPVLKVSDTTTAEGQAKFTAYVDHLITIHASETNTASAGYRGGKSWQTVHMCVFDQENLTLRIWTQEGTSNDRLFTLRKDPGDYKVDMYKEYADETVTNGILVAANGYTDDSLTKKNIASFTDFETNSVVGMLSNSGVRIAVDGTRMAIMDKDTEQWAFDTNDMKKKQDILPYPTNAIPAGVIVGIAGAPDYENVSNKAVNALQRSETGAVIKVSTDYTNLYTNQAPDYANVSNKAMTALQEHQSLTGYLPRSETGDVIRVATDYADRYANQSPDYNTVSNKAMTALQEHQSLSNYLTKGETVDVLRVANAYSDKYKDQAPDYDNVSNKAMTALQSHQSLANYLTRGETVDVIKVATDYADKYKDQAPDYANVSNKAMTALQSHQSLEGYLQKSETTDVIRVATDHAGYIAWTKGQVCDLGSGTTVLTNLGVRWNGSQWQMHISGQRSGTTIDGWFTAASDYPEFLVDAAYDASMIAPKVHQAGSGFTQDEVLPLISLNISGVADRKQDVLPYATNAIPAKVVVGLTSAGILMGDGTSVSAATADEDYAKSKIFDGNENEINADGTVSIMYTHGANVTNTTFTVSYGDTTLETLVYNKYLPDRWSNTQGFNQSIYPFPNPTGIYIVLGSGEVFSNESLPSNITDGNPHEVQLSDSVTHTNATFTITFSDSFRLNTMVATTNFVNDVVASDAITNGGARVYADAKFATKLTGVTYDFDDGSNFTRRVYEVLTNVIDRMGGSVINPPTFNNF